MESRRKKEKKSVEDRGGMKERLCRALDLCPDALGHESYVEIRGRGSVTVSGCGKILVYTPERICLSLEKGSLSVEGQRLVCTSYFSGAVGIDGHVFRVSFEED